MTTMIHAMGLTKRYGDVLALDGLDLDVQRGTVLGLLGPNGAGKTTAVRILATLLEADGGSAEVAGIDVFQHPDVVRTRIGLSGQYAAVDDHLTGFENLYMVGRLYHLSRASARSRATELLARFELDGAAKRPAKTYSGGMRRRLDLAASLVISPAVIFLDEPTTGLDPRSRNQLWVTVEELVEAGCTVLLTTQYMEEADRLADDIVVIDRGQKIAHGSSDELKRQVGGERIELTVTRLEDLAVTRAILMRAPVEQVQVEETTRTLTAAVTGGADVLRGILQRLGDADVSVVDVGLRRPTLDDVFLTLTGHGTNDPKPSLARRARTRPVDDDPQDKEVML